MNKKPNKLITQKSPYLLQHAYNPVEWNIWGEEAFSLARKSNKPIFLSVGYSTCYWCHVMEREVFENEEIAELMNEYFINIKVDREEMPEVDRVYMSALQSMTGTGGWPMSMFLTPDLKPFYGATYIPPKAKYGRAGFEDVITEVHNVWTNKNNEVIESSNRIYNILLEKISYHSSGKDSSLYPEIISNAFKLCLTYYDYDYGGFGAGNKFPRTPVLDFLLHFYYDTKNIEALDMVTFTLNQMNKGGIHDHLSGGFHRYSVDNRWQVPHFEKMLYDQSQIAITYLETYKITRDISYIKTAEEIIKYVIKSLTSEEHGFFSAEDAESIEDNNDIKKEGAYYLWTKKEIDDLLGQDNSAVFCYHFGVEHLGNILYDPHDTFGNSNVLYIANDIYDTAKKFGSNPDEINNIIEKSKSVLFQARNKKNKPFLDDKIITSWNALMISAFVRVYEITENNSYLEIAKNSAEFLHKYLYDENRNILYHRFRERESKYEGGLSDYSFLVKALIEIYEATFETKYLERAILYNNIAIKLFYDETSGGFFDCDKERNDIYLKTKEIYDGAEPSGNAVQIINLIKLSLITGNKEFNKIAELSLKHFSYELLKNSFSSPLIISALMLFLKQPVEIIVSGNLNLPVAVDMLKIIRNAYMPNKVILYADDKISNISPFINEITKNDDKNKPLIYICENYRCNLPVDNPIDLSNTIKQLISKK